MSKNVLNADGTVNFDDMFADLSASINEAPTYVHTPAELAEMERESLLTEEQLLEEASAASARDAAIAEAFDNSGINQIASRVRNHQTSFLKSPLFKGIMINQGIGAAATVAGALTFNKKSNGETDWVGALGTGVFAQGIHASYDYLANPKKVAQNWLYFATDAEITAIKSANKKGETKKIGIFTDVFDHAFFGAKSKQTLPEDEGYEEFIEKGAYKAAITTGLLKGLLGGIAAGYALRNPNKKRFSKKAAIVAGLGIGIATGVGVFRSTKILKKGEVTNALRNDMQAAEQQMNAFMQQLAEAMK
jgi:hypothetical protein